MAINKAQDLVRKSGNLSVPLPLRNAPTKLMKELGYGEEYKYSHNFTNNFVNQEFLPSEIAGTNFYEHGSATREKEIWETIKNLWGDKYQ
jgi:putative ATPase